MKKEVIKGITMLTMLVAIAFATAVVSANAQTPKTVVSNVPFEFVVGDVTLAAGEYRINRPLGNALTIQAADSNSAASRLSNEIQPRTDKRHARLVFRQYGDRYFLAEVWTGSDGIGRQLLKSRQERAIEREISSLASKLEHGECGYGIVELAAVLR
jgi:hypothetical protein